MEFPSLPDLQLITSKLFGHYPVAITCSFVIFWFSAGLALFLYLFSPAGAESQIVEGARTVGLIATENRGTKTPLPPEEFLRQAKSEILITGATAHRTFDVAKPVLIEALKKGKKIYVIILAPNSKGAKNLSPVESMTIKDRIEQVLEIIDTESAFKTPAFQIRFFEELPPFTAVMIDGDVAQTGTEPDDSAGIVRVQPRTAFGIQSEGVILQFAQTDNDFDGFKNYSKDLRAQWNRASIKTDLLNP